MVKLAKPRGVDARIAAMTGERKRKTKEKEVPAAPTSHPDFCGCSDCMRPRLEAALARVRELEALEPKLEESRRLFAGLEAARAEEARQAAARIGELELAVDEEKAAATAAWQRKEESEARAKKLLERAETAEAERAEQRARAERLAGEIGEHERRRSEAARIAVEQRQRAERAEADLGAARARAEAAEARAASVEEQAPRAPAEGLDRALWWARWWKGLAREMKGRWLFARGQKRPAAVILSDRQERKRLREGIYEKRIAEDAAADARREQDDQLRKLLAARGRNPDRVDDLDEEERAVLLAEAAEEKPAGPARKTARAGGR